MEFCSTKSPSEIVELKFNMLLLLRYRYSNGIQATLLNGEYRRFFGKEINEKLFNPLAIDPAIHSIRVMGGDIEVSKKANRIYFHAKDGCSDEEMQFVANAISSYKESSNNYVDIKSVVPESRFFNENVENLEYASTNVFDEQDPLEAATPTNLFNMTEFNNNAVVKDEYNGNTMEKKTEEFLQHYETPGIECNIIEEQSAYTHPDCAEYYTPSYSLCNSVIPDQNSVTFELVNYTPEITNGRSGEVESVKTKSREGFHECSYKGCKKYYHRLKLLQNHIRFEHPEGNESNYWICSTAKCKKKFNDKNLLQRHEQRCSLRRFHCSWEGCDKTFHTSKLMHGHITAVHRKVNLPVYKCSTPGCTQTCENFSRLQTHENRCRFKYETMLQMENESVQSASSPNSPELITIT